MAMSNALKASPGSKIWSYPAGPVSTSPTVADGVVYVGSEGGIVYALNASSGAKIWSYATGDGCETGEECDPIASSAAVVNGRVYVGSLYGNLYALRAATGGPLWRYQTGGFCLLVSDSGRRHRFRRVVGSESVCPQGLERCQDMEFYHRPSR
jgi:outer membrane protein assembly factor BamB